MNDFYTAKEQPWADFWDEIDTVVIEDGVTSVGSYSFCSVGSNVEKIILGNTVERIGEFAFMGCEKLTELTIPDSMTNIEVCAFGSCDKLENITLPEDFTFRGGELFDDTLWYENLQKENPLVIVNNCVIDGAGCSGEVVIPDGVIAVCGGAFEYNSSITSVIIPESCTSVGLYAFSGCTELQEIVLPEAVTEIGMDAFEETPWYEAVKGDEPVVIINGVLLDGIDAAGDVVIPDGVRTICYWAFLGNEGITSVTIPESTVSIGKMSFCKCSSLTDITIMADDCEIADNMTDPSMNAVIHGRKGSSAEQYAEINGIEFAEIK